MAKQKKSNVNVRSTIILNDRAIADTIERRLADVAENQFQDLIKGAVNAAVDRLVAAIGTKLIEAEVVKTLSAGWPTTNQYGESTGKMLSLRDRVGLVLNMTDGYGNQRRWLDELIKKRVDEVVNKDLKGDIDQARAAFKQQVNGVLDAVIKKAVAEHLGVKVG